MMQAGAGSSGPPRCSTSSDLVGSGAPPGCQWAGGLLKSSSALCPALSCFGSLEGPGPSWAPGLGKGLAGICASRPCSGCRNAAAPGCSTGPRRRRTGPEVWRACSPLAANLPGCPGPAHPRSPSLLLPEWDGQRAQPRDFLSNVDCPLPLLSTWVFPTSRQVQDHQKQQYQ
jgi:hypothetical protein